MSKRKIHDSLRNAVKRILLKQWTRPFYKLLKSFFSLAESWGNFRTDCPVKSEKGWLEVLLIIRTSGRSSHESRFGNVYQSYLSRDGKSKQNC